MNSRWSLDMTRGNPGFFFLQMVAASFLFIGLVCAMVFANAAQDVAQLPVQGLWADYYRKILSRANAQKAETFQRARIDFEAVDREAASNDFSPERLTKVETTQLIEHPQSTLASWDTATHIARSPLGSSSLARTSDSWIWDMKAPAPEHVPSKADRWVDTLRASVSSDDAIRNAEQVCARNGYRHGHELPLPGSTQNRMAQVGWTRCMLRHLDQLLAVARATHAWAHPGGTSRAGWQPSGSEMPADHRMALAGHQSLAGGGAQRRAAAD